MLDYDQIKSYFSEDLIKRSPKGILIEYLQCEVLDSLFKQSGAENLSFIGGTAIRIIYNSQRFSEDLDFDNFGLSYRGFEAILNKTCAEISAKGFTVEKRFIKRDENYHCYLRYPELLGKLGLSGHKEEKILISVDVQQKKKIFRPQIKTLNKFGVYRDILVNPPAILLAQKLLTIVGRQRSKGRDFYDASFLFGLGDPDYMYIKKITKLDKKAFDQKLMAHCRRLDLKYLAKEVEPFLFDSSQKERVLNFNKLIKEKLEG